MDLDSQVTPPVETRPKQEAWRAAARPRPRLRGGLPRRRGKPRWLRYLAIVGPGIIAASAGNDAGNIASYASAGAKYGYQVLWAVVLVTLSFVLVQVMAARLGAVTGKGFTDLVRERFGVRWMGLALLTLFVANAVTVVSEFAGIAAAAELFGVSRYIAVPVMLVVIGWLVVKGSFSKVERVFLVLTLGFFTYLVVPFLAHPHWGEVARNTLVPSIQWSGGFLVLLAALIGSTLTPYQSVFEQSDVVAKGLTANDYKAERLDAISGVIFSNLIDYFIIVATGATLFIHKVDIQTAADAAKALEPAAGRFAGALFGAGLFSASTLAASVVPRSMAFAICQAMGWPSGFGKELRQAPIFYGLFAGLLLFGVAVTLVPGISLISLIIFVQVINAILLPILLILTVLLASDRDLMGDRVNGRAFNVAAWATTIVISLLAIVIIITSVILPIFGIQVGG